MPKIAVVVTPLQHTILGVLLLHEASCVMMVTTTVILLTMIAMEPTLVLGKTSKKFEFPHKM